MTRHAAWSLAALVVAALVSGARDRCGGQAPPPADRPPWATVRQRPASQPVFDVPRTDALSADGKAGDWGDGGFRIEALAGSAETLCPRLRLAWNEKGLWLLAQVRETHAKGEGSWPLGMLEVVAADRAGSPTSYRIAVSPAADPPDRVQLGDHRVRALYDPRRQREKMLPPLSVTVVTERTDEGYLVEALLPWANLGLAPKLGDETALAVRAFSAAPTDSRGKRTGALQATWYPFGYAASDTRRMHRVRLAEIASPPVTVPGSAADYAAWAETSPPTAGVHRFEDTQLYIPPGARTVRGVYVIWPGYGSREEVDPAAGSRRSYAIHARRALVEQVGFALMGMTYIPGKSTPDSPATEKVLVALRHYAKATGQTELADAPLIVDGFSQGSNLTLCNLVAKIPERIIAFGAFGYVNPEWPVSEASRKVPGVLHCGERDQHFSRYKQVFAANRPKGAPWSLTLVPGLGHGYGDCQHLALPFYATMIERRLPARPVPGAPVRLKDVDQTQGWLGAPNTLAIAPAGKFRGEIGKSSWFPDRYTALVWARLSRGEAITMKTLAEILKDWRATPATRALPASHGGKESARQCLEAVE